MTEAKIKVESPIKPERVALYVKQGTLFVCAACVHFHEAQDSDAHTCGKVNCGGPHRGNDFPDYEGPLEGVDHGSFCMVCGDHSVVEHIPGGAKRRFGLCEKHLDFARRDPRGALIGVRQGLTRTDWDKIEEREMARYRAMGLLKVEGDDGAG